MVELTLSFHPIESIQKFFYNTLIKNDNWQLYVEGITSTLLMTVMALFLGTLLGTLIAFIKYHHSYTGKLKFLNFLAGIYTTIIRGTPVMVQLLFTYYVVFSFAPREYKVLIAALCFGINSGAYLSEIFRSGIQSVNAGQMEAARSLGLSHMAAMRYVILPQAVRNILPALFNEFIALLKETSIAKTVAIMDITNAGDSIRSRDQTVSPLLLSALLYLILVLLMEQIQKVVERRISKHDQGRQLAKKVR